MIKCHAQRAPLCFVMPAFALYLSASLTWHWFTLPFGYYGIWSVQFCDILNSCQMFIPIYNDQPVWYHGLQVLSIVVLLCLFFANLLLISHVFGYFCIPSSRHRFSLQRLVSVLCFISAFSIAVMIGLFYIKLQESSPRSAPKVSYSTVLAGAATLCAVLAGVISQADCHNTCVYIHREAQKISEHGITVGISESAPLVHVQSRIS